MNDAWKEVGKFWGVFISFAIGTVAIVVIPAAFLAILGVPFDTAVAIWGIILCGLVFAAMIGLFSIFIYADAKRIK